MGRAVQLQLPGTSRRRRKKKISDTGGRYGAFTRTIPVDRLTDWVRLAERCRTDLGEPFSIEAAVVDLLLFQDSNDGDLPSQRSAAERWGWGYKQVRNRWADLLTTVEDWKTSFGRNSVSEEIDHEKGAHKGRTKGARIGDSTAESKGKGARRAHEGRKPDGYTIYSPNSQLSTEENHSDSEGNTGGDSTDRTDRLPPEKSAPSDRDYRSEAEEIWKLYPKKRGKARAVKSIIALLKSGRRPEYFDSLAEAVREYAAARAGEDSRYTMNGSTFFGPSEHFDDDPAAWWEMRSAKVERPIPYAEWCRLQPDEQNGHRPIYEAASRRLCYLRRGEDLPGGYVEGYPPSAE